MENINLALKWTKEVSLIALIGVWIIVGIIVGAQLFQIKIPIIPQVKVNQIVSNLETTSTKLASTSKDLAEFSSETLTSNQAKELNNLIEIQSYNSQVISNEIRSISTEAKATQIELRQTLIPIVKDIKPLLGEVNNLVVEARRQVKQNGDEVASQIHSNGQAINSILTKTEPEVIAILKELRASSEHITVLTNDPSIPTILHNLESTSSNTSKTTSNIEVLTGELSELSKHLIEPIIHPPKRTGIKRIIGPLYTVFKFVNGTGNLFYIIQKF